MITPGVLVGWGRRLEVLGNQHEQRSDNLRMMMRRRMIIMLIMMRRRYLAELNAMPESMLIMRIRMIGMLIMIMS